MTNNTITGYYAIAEKIIHALGNILTPLTQAIYPLLSKKYIQNKSLFFRFIEKLSLVYVVTSMIIIITMYIYGDLIITIVTGNIDQHVKEVYSILIFTVVTIPLGPLFTQVLNIMKLKKDLSRISKNTFIFTITLSPISIYFYSTIGLATIAVLSQILIILLYVNKIKTMNAINNVSIEKI
jgi:PST family polysaccharide transporter